MNWCHVFFSCQPSWNSCNHKFHTWILFYFHELMYYVYSKLSFCHKYYIWIISFFYGLMKCVFQVIFLKEFQPIFLCHEFKEVVVGEYACVCQVCRSRGCQGCAPPNFGKSVNPISTRAADYAHHITTAPPPRSLDLPTALCVMQ